MGFATLVTAERPTFESLAEAVARSLPSGGA
jgi:hypothetical protein